MKITTPASFFALVIASQLLSGCGSSVGNTGTSASPNPAALGGNWLLAGSRQLREYPFLATALVVSGNQISAQGDMMVPCSNSPGSAVGGSFFLSGQINSDGTFQLGEISTGGQPNASSIQVAISGSAPAGTSSAWQGTYTFTDLAGYTSCIVNLTAPFSATALPAIAGTYSGTLSSGTGGSIVVNAAITQGTGVSSPGALGTIDAYIPLTATVTVSGSSCFTHGTSSSFAGSSTIAGDIINMSFTMNDGSNVMLSGFLSEPDGLTLYPATFGTIGQSNCSNQVNTSGTLTRQ
jgi:hypothetical protein